MTQRPIIHPEEADTLLAHPGFGEDFAQRAIGAARHCDPVEFREHLRIALSVVDRAMSPFLPEHLHRPLADDFLAGGGTPEQLEKVAAAFFQPHLSLAPGLRFRAEIEAAMRAGADGSVEAVFARFLAEACDLAPGATCLPADLFRHYQTWATGAGLAPVGKRAFYLELEFYAPSVKRGRPNGPDGRQSPVTLLVGIRPR